MEAVRAALKEDGEWTNEVGGFSTADWFDKTSDGENAVSSVNKKTRGSKRWLPKPLSNMRARDTRLACVEKRSVQKKRNAFTRVRQASIDQISGYSNCINQMNLVIFQ